MEEKSPAPDTSLNDYIREINQAEAKITEMFQKSLMTLSAGALGVSITFLSSRGVAGNVTVLFFSWGFFGVTVVLTILSYFVEKAGLEFHLRIAMKYHESAVDENYPDLQSNPYHTALYVMSWFSAICFILGFIFTAIFIGGGLT